MRWRKIEPFSGTGVLVQGDRWALPSTSFEPLMWIVRPLWTKKAALRLRNPEDAKRGYRVGFRNIWGETQVLDEIQYDRGFQMRVGREDVVFFALDLSGNEIPLERAAIGRLLFYPDYPIH